MACDVTSNFLDGYTLPIQKKSLLGRIPFYVPLLFLAALVLALPALLLLAARPWAGWAWMLAAISGLSWLPVLYLFLQGIKSLFTKKNGGGTGSFTAMLKKYSGVFFSLPPSVLKQMLVARIKSVFLLANDIYLKQIRRMYYNDVFSNPDYKGMVIQNAIYDLSKVNFNESATTGPLFPSPEMIALAKQARMMGTTLWFDSGDTTHMKEAIIATGQFTTCYNLLKY
ncbi:MAG TPA: hypothetical protein VLD19_10985 [Chitinophagaceae bacterium]|nr:hypothetical protein [Chitinophagaceae bacterium]